MALLCRHFNTSHVSINRFTDLEAKDAKLNFNTSHVSINQIEDAARKAIRKISIHLMFLLI